MIIKVKRTQTAEPRDVAERMRALDASLDLLDHAVAESLGIGRADLRAMELISRGGPSSCGRLAEGLGLTTGSVTALVDRMEAAGYLERVRGSADRRTVLVALTVKAADRERRTFGPLVRDTVQLLSRYGPRELALISEFLDGARAVTEAARERIAKESARGEVTSPTERATTRSPKTGRRSTNRRHHAP